jgi:bifunctional NMN adenylyltransferase/nudix hydrolase
MKYVCSAYIDDWRFRDERDKVKTIFYACKHIFGTPKPEDDLKHGELHWVKLTDLNTDMVVPEHAVLVAAIKKFDVTVLG